MLNAGRVSLRVRPASFFLSMSKSSFKKMFSRNKMLKLDFGLMKASFLRLVPESMEW